MGRIDADGHNLAPSRSAPDRRIESTTPRGGEASLGSESVAKRACISREGQFQVDHPVLEATDKIAAASHASV
jgi:hypothetical protein